MRELVLSEIQIVTLKPQNGLVGFASCILNSQFYIGNIAIYTSPSSLDGFRLVFPNKKLASGQIVDCFYPISKEAGDLVSMAIIKRYLEIMDNFHYSQSEGI